MKKIYIVLMCLFSITAVVLVIGIIWNHASREVQKEDVEELRDQLKVYQTTAETETPPEDITADTETEEPVIPETEETTPEKNTVPEETETKPPETQTTVPETKPVKLPEASLNFQTMWETNPDICAWIEIEGTKVDYPVLQNPDDDDMYLSTAVDGQYYIGGSLFTQATYNNKDFNDPVTIIYGHTMRSGTLFGQLQPIYSSSKGFSEHSEIKLYLPDEIREYTVFAAVPYSKIHILDAYDFKNDYWYENFFDGVMDIREFGAQFNKEIVPEPGDHVIILSTCLNEDSTRRFLVMAIYQDDME